jgi:hypothetical protein
MQPTTTAPVTKSGVRQTNEGEVSKTAMTMSKVAVIKGRHEKRTVVPRLGGQPVADFEFHLHQQRA